MPALLGGRTTPLETFYTDDAYYLTDNLNYAVDYWFPHVSISPTPLTDFIETADKNLPVETVTFSINSASISHSYLYDYYFRIHVVPNKIDLGNVLTDQVQNIEIWNAFLESKTIAAITSTSPSITLVNPTGENTLKALQATTFQLTVNGTGSPLIDDLITIAFLDISSYISLTGKRVTVFPFPALTDYKETQEWLTDIIASISSEQNLQLREIPRITYDYNYYFKTVEEFSLAKNIAKTYSHIGLGIPIWSQISYTSSLPNGSTFININTLLMELKVGSLLISYKDYTNYEVLEVLNFTSIRIDLKLATLKNYSGGCFIIPLKICTLPKEITFSRANSSKNKASARFVALDNYVFSDITTFEIFKTLPLITKNSVIESSLSEQFERKTETIDSKTGKIDIIDLENYTRHRQNLSLVAHGQDNIYKLKRFLDYLKGRYNYLYLTTFSKDIVPVTTSLAVGANQILVKNSGLTAAKPKHLRIVGNVSVNVDVIAVGEALGNELINFTPITVAITNITHLEIITKVRSDSDNLELMYDYSNSKFLTAKCVIPVLESN